MDADGVNVAITGAAIALLIISSGLIFFMILFYRYKRRSIIEKQERKMDYLRRLSETEQEIQHETLNAVGRELHDNVGQLLTVANMHLNSVQEDVENERLLAAEEVLNRAVNELRSLAKSLNAERIQDIGLYGVLEAEEERLNQVAGIHLNLKTIGAMYSLGKERETILYRIVQEFLSNAIKHSNTKNVDLVLAYEDQGLDVSLSDFGSGFDVNDRVLEEGSGLRNMRVRAEMIHADMRFSSTLGHGTELNIFIPKNNWHV